MREQNGAPMRRLREPTQKTIASRSTRLAVGGPQELAAGRAARVEHPLQLGRGDDVGVAPVAVLLEVGRVERLEAGGDDDRAHRLLRPVAELGLEARELALQACERRLQAHVDARRGRACRPRSRRRTRRRR